jgi:transmembrane sensor
MSADRQAAMRQAIDWHIRLGQADGQVWHEFVAWLEADELHAEVYDRVALDDSLLTRPLTVADNDVEFAPQPARRRIWAGAAGLAITLSVVTTGFVMLPRHEGATTAGRYAIETTGAATRSVVLADGSRIDLNRDTRLVLDRADPRFAMLDHGQAYFTIRHDPSAPFKVDVGGMKLQDVGTAFDVIHERDRLDVAVAQGGVIFQPDREAIALKPGMTLAVRAQSAAVVGHAAVESIGGWQHNRLEYQGAPLAEVAQDAARMTGTTIIVDKTLSKQRFWGTLRSDHGADDLIANLAALTGNRANRSVGGWILTTGEGGGAH